MNKKHKGLNTHRFKDNPEEKSFAEAWSLENERGHLLAYLLDKDNGTKGLIEPSERDHLVAATVIQWLGSPVGQGFLRDVGYEKKKP